MNALIPPFSRRPLAALVASLAASLALVACGGGGSSGGSDSTAGSSSYTRGAISGFGSVIVNGVHYDLDTDASVDDDDDDDGIRYSEADLELGMVIELVGSSIEVDASGNPRARASHVRFASEIVGLVQAKGTDTLTILGQTVKLTDATVFASDDFPNRLASVSQGSVVEVYGFLNPATGVYTATRVELEEPAPGRGEYKLRGVIGPVNLVDDEFTIGGLVVSYAHLQNAAAIEAAIQASVASGAVVHVSFEVGTSGVPVLVELKTTAPLVVEAAEAELEGYVSALVEGDDTRFFVNGVLVQVTADTEIEGELFDGALVEVEGRFVNGILIADEVEFEEDESEYRFELDGQIQSINPATNSFEVKGVWVQIDNMRSTVFKDGASFASLRQGLDVEVEGVMSKTGPGIVALSIEIDD